MVSLSDSLSFSGQQSRQIQPSFPSVGLVAHWCSTVEILQVPGFPKSLVLPFLAVPIHKVNQENCNYGALEMANFCAKLNSWGAFPTSGFSV